MSGGSKKITDASRISGEVIRQQLETKSPAGALSELNRKISEKDLGNKAVVRMIIDKNDQLEKEVESLKTYERKFYEADKKAEVTSETLKGLEESVGSRNLMFLLGGILAGFLPTAWTFKYLFWTDLSLSIILIVGGFLNIKYVIIVLKATLKRFHK